MLLLGRHTLDTDGHTHIKRLSFSSLGHSVSRCPWVCLIDACQVRDPSDRLHICRSPPSDSTGGWYNKVVVDTPVQERMLIYAHRTLVQVWLRLQIWHDQCDRVLGPKRPHKHKEPTFWFQGPVQGGIPETMVCRTLLFMWSFGAPCLVVRTSEGASCEPCMFRKACCCCP